jgi:uncharacterized membrane protein
MKRILYVAPLFEVEAGYLLRAIKKSFRVECIQNRWRSYGTNEIPKKFPKAAKGLNRYRAVIFSDVGAKNFQKKQLEALKEYVRSGGGFLMIGGYASYAGYELMGNFAGTAVEEVLPVRISKSSDAQNVIRGFSPEVKNRRHTLMKGISWSNLPVAVGYNKVRAKKDGEILLAYRKDPILAVRKYGKGRAAAFMTDAHPHWSGGWTDWKYYSKFWTNLLNWVAKR